MKRFRWLLPLLLSLEIAVPSVVCAQEAGSIVGWGSVALPAPDDMRDIVDVVARYGSSFGLRADGHIVEWGLSSSGRLPVPNSGFTALSCGDTHVIALRADGSLAAWGNNWNGACDLPSPNSGFVAIAAGGGWVEMPGYWSFGCGDFNLALRSNGFIRAWGDNSFQQCNVPSPNSHFIAIAAGGDCGLGLKDDGRIVSWGGERPVPVPEPNEGFVDIASGQHHFLGLKEDGSIVAWGRNYDGECDVPEPNADFVAMAASSTPYWGEHATSIGLRSDGSVVVWGALDTVPEPNTDFVKIAAGLERGVGLKRDGRVVCWGEGVHYSGSEGLNFQDSDFVMVSPSRIPMGLRANGTLLDVSGRSPSPDSDFIAVASSIVGRIGLKMDGSIVVFDGTAAMLVLPTHNADFIAVASGGACATDPWGSCGGFNVALSADGSILAWGDFPWMSFVPEPNQDFVSIASGSEHVVAVRADGSLAAWGYNHWGQCDVPQPNTGFAAAATGSSHSLGLRTDGSVVAWGSNESGQCDIPEPNEDFVAIAAGEDHSLGLKADGTIVGWGSDSVGQITVPEPNAGFFGIAAGEDRSLALRRQDVVAVDGPPATPESSSSLRIHSVYPNPFNPTATLAFETLRPGPVSLAVHELNGRLVLRQELGTLPAGQHAARWRGRDTAGRNVASGFYLLRLEDGAGGVQSRKCLLLR